MLIKIIKPPVIVFLFFSCGACHQKNQEKLSPVFSGKDSTLLESGRPAFHSGIGTLVIPSADIVLITSQSAGLIKTVSFPSGSYVKKGETLVLIENIEFLKLQQQYLEAKSEFDYNGEDLKRQGGLAIENATSIKKMQQAQRDYLTSEIRFRSFEKQLSLIGFNTDSLDADHLTSVIALHAPVSGYIDKIRVHSGNQISAGETILVLVRKYEPVIVFEMPEEFYPKLKTGNQIDFFFPRDTLVHYKARLTFIDRQTDTSRHLIKAWAIPLKSSSNLIPGMQVNVRLPL
jgi:cobalt-zinc-cadmium efflux system membrane fusion protein